MGRTGLEQAACRGLAQPCCAGVQGENPRATPCQGSRDRPQLLTSLHEACRDPTGRALSLEGLRNDDIAVPSPNQWYCSFPPESPFLGPGVTRPPRPAPPRPLLGRLVFHKPQREGENGCPPRASAAHLPLQKEPLGLPGVHQPCTGPRTGLRWVGLQELCRPRAWGQPEISALGVALPSSLLLAPPGLWPLAGSARAWCLP